jgi:hypothetical protein
MLDCKPTSHNIIIETNMLMETLESHCVCKECNGPVIASFKTTTIATKVILECKDEDCGFYYQSASPSSANLEDGDKPDDRERITDYAINILFVLGFISSGDGGAEAARVLGLLGLPNDTTMETRTFPKIEERISAKVQKLGQDVLLDNLSEEAKLYFADPNDFA